MESLIQHTIPFSPYTNSLTDSKSLHQEHIGTMHIELYGALIVKDTIPGNVYDRNLPDQYTLSLVDWYSQPTLTDVLAYGCSQGF